MKLPALLLPALVAAGSSFAETAVVTLMNPGMESGEGLPTGWNGRFGACVVSRDTTTYHKGKASLLVDRSTNMDAGRGCAHQMVRLPPAVKKVKVSGWVKSEGTAKVVLAAHFYDERFGMSEVVPVAEATTAQDWHLAEQEVPVPDTAVRMAVALYVEGQGRAWLDDVSLGFPGSEVKVETPKFMVSPPPQEPQDPKKVPLTAVPGFYAEQPEAWLQFHKSFARRAKDGEVDVLFLGDSITQGWGGPGRDVWDKSFAPLKAAFFGLGGDKTGNLLWRLDHGEIEGLAPKVVVLMIGVNNLWSGENSSVEVADGIHAVVKKLRTKLPQSKVLVMGILPTGKDPAGLDRVRAAMVNTISASIGNGGDIRFVDLSALFLTPGGNLLEGAYAQDDLHLTSRGYEILAKGILPWVTELSKPGAPQ